MSSIAKWINEIQHLKNRERLLSILYTLGIATREQLEVITGWTSNKVRDRIKELRDQVPIPEHHKQQKKLLEQMKKDSSTSPIDLQKLEAKVAKDAAKIERGRDAWITILQPEGRKGVSYYTLGTEGITLAREIRREFVKKKVTHKPKTQTDHFYGVNEVLCRLRRRGILETDWMSAGEALQDLHYYWNREHAGKGIPYRPDALLHLKERWYVEFDTGAESNGRLRNRFNNCLKLYNGIEDTKKDRLPNKIIWICRTDKRKQRIEQIAREVLQDYKRDNGRTIRVPEVYCLLEGNDTDFLLGEIEAVPFWE